MHDFLVLMGHVGLLVVVQVLEVYQVLAPTLCFSPIGIPLLLQVPIVALQILHLALLLHALC